LLVYELILTLHLEIEFIWRRKWSFLTILYILQRYLPLFDTAFLAIHHSFAPNLTIQYCTLNYKMSGWSSITGFVLSQVILALRIWAVWETSIPVALGLITFFLACWIPCLILFSKFLKTLKFAILPIPNFRGCFITEGSHIIYLGWVLAMVYD
ncbi:hypothetical protein L218DRAFT_831117, partial [Marasmius fiardii PR-910]